MLLKRIEEAARVPLVVGLDESEAALRQAESRAVAGAVTALPFRDRQFEVVMCLQVLEHVPDSACGAAVAELARVAERDILVGVPYREKLMAKTVACAACGKDVHAEGHLRSYDESRLADLIPGWQLVSAGILGKRVVRLPDWLSRFRRRFMGFCYPADGFACPHCGGEKVAAPRPARNRLLFHVGRVMVWLMHRLSPHQPYWIIGHYRRAVQGGLDAFASRNGE
jgi:uncharacterized protein with PIN domain